MLTGDVFRLGVVGLRTRKLRAALSAVGIAIGIATMMVVVSIPASGQRAVADQLAALGTNLLRVQPQSAGDEPVPLPVESVAMAARIGPVTEVSAVANTHAVVRRSDLVDPYDGSGLTVLAARTDLPAAVNASMHSGRWLTPVTAAFPTVVLGFEAAARLGNPPQVSIGTRSFTVTGVLAPVPLAPDLDQSVLIGWDVATEELDFDGHPTVIYVRAREEALEQVRAVLPATVSPQLPGLVQVSRPSDALAAKRATDNAFGALLLGLAGVSLLVGGVGVANTMVISVLERRREIGLRRALGAPRGHIRLQFMAESVILSGLGGITGTAAGLAAAFTYASWQSWPLVVPPLALAGGLGGALLVGVVAGVYPATRAARLPPTSALSGA
ncbi:ABC transporter permease [Actinoplanes couchii]|uniref:ABC transporter permease n=1 Tax=Actinoplanes couchii TaxID=403638 RepID=A0ABQ3XTF7_9ACTN|nr:ABC transporter permease [Actinoplanes couchii]MDR6317042.1 putative ABC transport system permease protein [Actinoplanes couchii]GID61710.1 ABC transporter permease [Actinoplanes couchii]